MAIEAFVELSKDEAIEHLRRAAWAPDIAICGHTGCEEHRGPSEHKRIHSLLGGLGADHDLSDAEQVVRNAEVVGWASSWLKHDLYVRILEDGRYREFYYDVPRPQEAALGLPEVGDE